MVPNWYHPNGWPSACQETPILLQAETFPRNLHAKLLDSVENGAYSGLMSGREGLRRELQRRGLKQREVARRMGVTEGHLSYLLAGKRPMSPRMGRLLSWATGISLVLILDEHEGTSI